MGAFSTKMINQSANMTELRTTDSTGEMLTTRQSGTERLMGKRSLACHSQHMHTAS